LFGDQDKPQCQDESIDDSPIRGTTSLADIYQRSNVVVCKLEGYEEALQEFRWQKAMEGEISMIQKNYTWELVNRPLDKNIIGVKWMFRTKLNTDSSFNKHKVRLIVKGYAQIFGVDYSDTFHTIVCCCCTHELKCILVRR
jgi:hypothetical protein